MRRSANPRVRSSLVSVLTAGLLCLVAAPASDAAEPKTACHEPPDDPQKVRCYATPNGGPGYLREDKPITTTAKLEEIIAFLGSLPDDKHIEIQLLTEERPDKLTVYQRAQYNPYLIQSYGGSANHKLIIQGIVQDGKWLTQFNGKPLIKITDPDTAAPLADIAVEELPIAPVGAGDLNDFLAELATMDPQSKLDLLALGQSAKYPIHCLEIRDSAFIVLRDLAFEDCWLSAIYIAETTRLSVFGSRFVGSRDAIFAAATSDPEKARYYEIAYNTWSSDLGKAIWHTVPWGVTHDGIHATRNGSLFASRNIAGSVKFHHNTIQHTYNGIRLVARKKEGECGQKCVDKTNRNVEIYSNRFFHVRDNPIEPEGRAERWAIFDNEFYNSYAPVSMDGVRDGPIYVWGNRAWYDELPGALCVDGVHWTRGTVYFFSKKDPGWRRVDPAGEYDPYCATHRSGRVFKLGPLARNASEADTLPATVNELPDLYVFHNSWYIRSVLFGGGLVRKLRHWNNAIFFTNCATTGGDSCRVMETAAEMPYGIYPTPDGQAVYYNFFSVYDPADLNEDDLSKSERLKYKSDHNVSNRGFPEIDGLDEASMGSVTADPMFEAPALGNFALQDRSPALRAACKVEYERDDRELKCAPFDHEPAADIGAIQSDPRFGQPVFRFKSPVPDESLEYAEPSS